MKGKFAVPKWPDLPKELCALIKDNKEFRKNIRQYNSVYGFTSMGVNYGGHLNDDIGKGGPYVFRLHGQIVHR